jgi:hypothetical protein
MDFLCGRKGKQESWAVPTPTTDMWGIYCWEFLLLSQALRQVWSATGQPQPPSPQRKSKADVVPSLTKLVLCGLIVRSCPPGVLWNSRAAAIYSTNNPALQMNQKALVTYPPSTLQVLGGPASLVWPAERTQKTVRWPTPPSCSLK